jgi:hypothetical protein
MPRVLVLLVFLLSAAPLAAQTAAPASGIRVRVTFSEAGTSRQVTGTLIFLDADSLAVLVAAPPAGSTMKAAPAVQPVPLARSQVTRLDVSTGRHSSAGIGALIGAGIGVVGGVILGVAGQCSGSGEDVSFCFETSGYVVGLGAVFWRRWGGTRGDRRRPCPS